MSVAEGRGKYEVGSSCPFPFQKGWTLDNIINKLGNMCNTHFKTFIQ